METRTYRVLHLFAGLGGGALGFRQARGRYLAEEGRFETLLGVDNSEEACADFEALTGAPSLCADVSALTTEQLRDACGGRAPDVVFTSPPCKGFSGLLSAKSAAKEKYQALNRLVFQGLWLTLEAWPDTPPKLIVLENVPRITSRGAELLTQLRALLAAYGYRFHESTHDCGELGGLAQHRRRFLLVARHERQVPTFVYKPPRRPLRSVGEVIGALPLPEDEAAGPLHRLPRLTWKTWIRLALIPAGGDWRDLPTDGPYAVVVASPRAPFNNVLRVTSWDAASGAVTSGGTPTSSGICVADPRLDHAPRKGAFRVVPWGDTAPTVIGGAGVGRSCVYAIADPRLNCSPRSGTMGVLGWGDPSTTVTGSHDVHAGTAAVADPRLPADTDRPDPPPIIIAADGTWHRPLTTLELAALQGLPVQMPDGSPLQLAGKSQTRWRERIGNAVPPPAAKAVAEALLTSLLASGAGETFVLGGTDVWVRPAREVRA